MVMTSKTSHRTLPIRIPSNASSTVSQNGEHNDQQDQDEEQPPQQSSPWSAFLPAGLTRDNSFGNMITRRLHPAGPSSLPEDYSGMFNHQPNQQQHHPNAGGDIVHHNNKWMLESPMTHHIIRQPRAASPTRRKLPKRRSQSFSDYIDQRDVDHSQHELLRKRQKIQQQQQQLPQSQTTPILQDSVGLPNDDSRLPLSSRSLAPPIHPIPLPLQRHDDHHISAAVSDPYATFATSDDSTMAIVQEYPEKEESTRTKEADSSIKIDGNEEDGKNNLNNVTTSAWRTLGINMLYGLINATIVIPVVMSFGNIIYQDPFFGAYAPVLIQLTMVSGIVHQLCFSTFSSLRFCVGSVQDAGLIFLSSMASAMVRYCKEDSGIVDLDDSIILATVTVGLGLAALVLGIGLMVIGKLKLAGYVQMLPTSVVAGYLAYIGFFCGKSGLALMAVLHTNSNPSTDASSSSSESATLTLALLWEHIWFVLPGLVGGYFIYMSVRTFRHVAVLPTCIAFLLACFYLGLCITGSSIEQATDHGWIRKAEQAPIWYHTWDYLRLDKVIWSAYPQLIFTELSMIFVVALSSSLDVAAIELEMAKPLNYNQELRMVGMSNIISGMTGGYTGSYIFSQSIFSLRAGIDSRGAGYCLAMFEMLVILSPVPLLSIVPNFFYGSLLGMICLDLMVEWLWDFYSRVSLTEYGIALTTFGCIQWLGVEYGIVLGVLVYIALRQCGIFVGEAQMVTNATDAVEEDEVEQEEDPEFQVKQGLDLSPNPNKDEMVNERIPLTSKSRRNGKGMPYYDE